MLLFFFFVVVVGFSLLSLLDIFNESLYNSIVYVVVYQPSIHPSKRKYLIKTEYNNEIIFIIILEI